MLVSFTILTIVGSFSLRKVEPDTQVPCSPSWMMVWIADPKALDHVLIKHKNGAGRIKGIS